MVLSVPMKVGNLTIPQAPNSITPDWLTQALQHADVLKAAKVVAFDVYPIAAGSGFVGQTARLRIEYDKQEAGAPATAFAKLSSADLAVRQQLRRVGLYETETGFYRDIAVLPDFPLQTPRPYLSLYDEGTGECLLLLEDLVTQSLETISVVVLPWTLSWLSSTSDPCTRTIGKLPFSSSYHGCVPSVMKLRLGSVSIGRCYRDLNNGVLRA